MKKYDNPEFELIKYDVVDTIMSSGDGNPVVEKDENEMDDDISNSLIN